MQGPQNRSEFLKGAQPTPRRDPQTAESVRIGIHGPMYCITSVRGLQYLTFLEKLLKMNPFRFVSNSTPLRCFCLGCNCSPKYLDLLLRNIPVSLIFLNIDGELSFQKVYKQFILDIQTDSQRDKIIAAKDTIVNNLTGAYDSTILDAAPTCIRNDDFVNGNSTKLRIFFRCQVMRTVSIFSYHTFMNLRIINIFSESSTNRP